MYTRIDTLLTNLVDSSKETRGSILGSDCLTLNALRISGSKTDEDLENKTNLKLADK